MWPCRQISIILPVRPCTLPLSPQLPASLELPWAPRQTVVLCWCFCNILYIYNLQALPLLGYQDELRATWILELRRGGRKGKRGPNRPAMPPLPGSYRLMGRQGFEGGVEVDRDGWLLTNSHWQPVNTGQPSRKVRAGMDKGPLDFQSFTLLGATVLSAQEEECLWNISGYFQVSEEPFLIVSFLTGKKSFACTLCSTLFSAKNDPPPS